MEQRIEVPAAWEQLPHLMAFVDELESCQPFADEQRYLLRLVVEEMSTNIIKYGYGDTQGVIQIICNCSHDILRITIRDQGHPFDPQDFAVDLSGDITMRTAGGLGIFLVRELADKLSYHHDPASGWNELVVVKGREQA